MQLPSCPYLFSGLAIIDSELTTVGGLDRAGRRTNRLFTLRQGKWVELYPPINTARSSPAVVSTSDGDYRIAIGGFDSGWTATVELFQVKSKRWYKLTDLPPRGYRDRRGKGGQLDVVCGTGLYRLGGTFLGLNQVRRVAGESDYRYRRYGLRILAQYHWNLW